MDITLAIITMNRAKVLERTLKSYYDNNFFELFNEVIILLQTNNKEERKLSEKYNLKIYSTEKNIGIGYGNNFLIDKIITEHFIICQNDFKLIGNDYKEIKNGINMINKGIINCYRLRNMENPGKPAHGAFRLIKPDGDLNPTHHCCLLYYNFIKDPHKDNKYKSIFEYNNLYQCYILSSKHACYTENPCIYQKNWYYKNIYNYNKISNKKAENNVQAFWEKQNFKIGIGKGIFCHDDS